MKSINPATGKLIRTYDTLSKEEASLKIEESNIAFSKWRHTGFPERRDMMKNLASHLRHQKDYYAGTITEEMGKVLKEAQSEIEKCAFCCDYYAENAETFLKDEFIKTEAEKSFITYQPLGVILAVMPWNFPFWQVFRFAAPTIMAGNSVILKHASNVPACALEIEKAFREAGFPGKLFQTLLVPSKDAETLISHPKVKAVTLTGSTAAGEKVAGFAATHIKKTVLELGGSDAYIVLEDADITSAAKICAKGRLINAGQSCIAAKRFIVVDDVYDKFVTSFKEELGNKITGAPMLDTTDIGPLATKDIRDSLHKQVLDSIDKGATCILGGKIPERDGFYYPPTLLVDVKPGMPAYEEELFGPVASIIRVKDERHAIETANDSIFGLGSAIFTKNIERGIRIAREEIESGACFVNSFVASDPRLPFGGIKQSGYGRELGSFGIKEFVNIKTISVQ
jgi:succinate-semialdehyde dehydrogenase/glutarate-semialdehyde dehydrogenase